ncbi:MAG: hypothetical protein EPO21_19240 [Chloroflexota bacterium]|nr:MAG: hypothetical protein EPO21_19240 [Chloroflexota bacterium]
MLALDLLGELIQRGARVSLVGDNFRVTGPRDVLTPQLRADLAKNKGGIVWLLRNLPPTECPNCGNLAMLRWFFTARGWRCWECWRIVPYPMTSRRD